MRHSEHAVVITVPPELYWRIVTAIELWHEQGMMTQRWTHRPFNLAVGIAQRFGYLRSNG